MVGQNVHSESFKGAQEISQNIRRIGRAKQSFISSSPSLHKEGQEKMNQHYELVLLLSLAFIVVCAILFKSRNRRLPPSPPSLPIIGHLHLLGKLPHHSLLKLAEKYGGLMFLRLGTVNTLVVSSPDAAKEVLRTHDHVFASRPATSASEHFGYKGTDLLWASYGEHWRHVRKLCTLELLTSKRVEMSRHVRKSEMSLLLSDLLNSSTKRSIVNLTTKLSDLTFNIMTRILMSKSYSGGTGGSSEKEQAMFFKDTITAAFKVASGIHIGDFISYLKWMDRHVPQIKVLQKNLDEFLQKEIDEHHKRWKHGEAPKDFVDVMLSISSTGGLSNTLMKALALDMVAAGTDTIAVTVEWALAELIRNPQVLKKAQRELKEVMGPDWTLEESHIPKLNYLQAVVKETFRLHPPAPLAAPHESTEPCEVNDYQIPAKTRVIVNVYAIGRDASVWEDPLQFNPERFLCGSDIDVRGHSFELLPFSSGRRMCPGMLMGLTTVQFVLGSLLHAFDWHMPEGQLAEELDMAEEFGLTVPRASPLKLVPSTRLPAEAYQKMKVENLEAM